MIRYNPESMKLKEITLTAGLRNYGHVFVGTLVGSSVVFPRW